MDIFRKLLIIAGLFTGVALRAESITWFHQDFENRQFFKIDQSAETGQNRTAGKYSGIISPHARIVDLDGSQALHIERIGHHRSFEFSGLEAIPAGRDYMLEFDLHLPDRGAIYFFLFDKDKRKLTGGSFRVNRQIQIPDKKEIWGTFGITTPGGTGKFRLTAKVNDGLCQVEYITPDGNKEVSRPMPLVHNTVPAVLQFGTNSEQNSKAVIDNIKITYSGFRDISGRKDAVTAATVSSIGFSGKFSTGDLTLTDQHGELTFELKEMSRLASVRIAAPETVQIKVEAVNHGGQRLVLANSKNWVRVAPGIRQADFNPAVLRSVYITFAGNAGSAVSSIGLYEDKTISQQSMDDLFLKEIYGEFDLPIYDGDINAKLHLFNVTAKPIQVAVTLKSGSDNKEHAKLIRMIVPGKNSIDFDLSELPTGYYIAEISDHRKPGEPCGKFRRLLRRQLLAEPVAPQVIKIAGQKLFFPDDYYLESCRNIDFRTVQAEVHKISKTNTVPELFMQQGMGLAVVDGKLVSPYQVMDNYFRNSSERRFMATADFDDLDNWEIKEISLDTKLPPLQNALAQNAIDSDWEKKTGPDGKINYQFYDPERDGKVNVRQIQFQYVHWMEAGTLGGEENQDWGVITPGRRTTWPIWYKAPGEARILTREPIFNDESSSGEFEDPTDSGDNFCGQWLSDDGQYVYYCRGHIIRRYPPYNVPYDNSANGLRILTICRTKDGINFERSFAAVPGRDEPLQGTQHYGGTQFRMKQGNGLRILLVHRYHAGDQRIFSETAYSWDGFLWKRFAGQKPLVDNPPPGDWYSGSLFSGVFSVIVNGKVYYPINWACDVYHIMAELLWMRDFRNLDGNFCRSYMQGRGFDKWPLWKYFRDYDHIAEYLRNAKINTGVMVWREDGLFYMEAKDIPGSFVTKSLTAGKQMRANLELAENGKAVFTLLDARNNPIPGFSRTVSGKTDEINLTVFDNIPDGVFKVKGEIINGKLCTLIF